MFQDSIINFLYTNEKKNRNFQQRNRIIKNNEGKFLDLKNIITEVKILLDGYNSSIKRTEDKLMDLNKDE